MGTATTEEDVAAVKDLLERCSLNGIEYHELSAKWTGTRPEEETSDVDVTINLQHRVADDGFGIRMAGNISVGYGEAQAVIAASYGYEGEMPEVRTVLAFANEVAVMTLFPYLREALGTITSKVFGDAVLLPILPRGGVGFDLDELDSPAVAAGD